MYVCNGTLFMIEKDSPLWESIPGQVDRWPEGLTI